jgi:succinate dehydrogenase/fumarate reductase flavoprotein subunit
MFPGMVITYALMEALEDMAENTPERAEIIKKARVTKVLREGDKSVGVEYEYDGKTHKAYGPVILATGGYAADFQKGGLLEQHRPDLLELSTTNGDHCTGDGQKMVSSWHVQFLQ